MGRAKTPAFPLRGEQRNKKEMKNPKIKINGEIDRLVDLKAQIRGVIEAVTDPNERMVLRYRYIHNMTWEQIGDELHADARTIRRWHARALSGLTLPENPIII